MNVGVGLPTASPGATGASLVEWARLAGSLGGRPRRSADDARARRGRPYGRSYLTPFSDRIGTDADVPTLVGGYIMTGDEINTIVGAGRADLCLLDNPTLDEERAVT